ncbi:MAG: acyl carrier protein [Veillonellaceae bacterium]|jgi:acyl carrier protein|nr:acyl carrier protein [Veillonellaceae bacterium]
MSRLESILQEMKPELDLQQTENFVETGILDSFDIIMLVSTLDEAFQIRIDGADIVPENFNNLDAIKKLVGKYGVIQ